VIGSAQKMFEIYSQLNFDCWSGPIFFSLLFSKRTEKPRNCCDGGLARTCYSLHQDNIQQPGLVHCSRFVTVA